jgi:hypothetical protein
LDYRNVHSKNEGPDLVPVKAVVVLLWLVAGLVSFVVLVRPGIDDINKVVTAPESSAAAGAP